jgi:hypothetical protein
MFSVGMRLSNVYVAVWSLFQYPFGSGVGTYSTVATEAYDLSDVGSLINAGDTVFTGTVSSLSQYIVEMGLFFLIFLGHIFYIGKKSLFTILLRALSFMFIFASFSILFPPTCFMLAITSFKNGRNNRCRWRWRSVRLLKTKVL